MTLSPPAGVDLLRLGRERKHLSSGAPAHQETLRLTVVYEDGGGGAGRVRKPIDHRTDLPAKGRPAAVPEPVAIAQRSLRPGRLAGMASFPAVIGLVPWAGPCLDSTENGCLTGGDRPGRDWLVFRGSRRLVGLGVVGFRQLRSVVVSVGC
jgi:hypothetical protein